MRSRAALAAAAAREAMKLEAAHENKIAASQGRFRRARSELDTALASVRPKRGAASGRPDRSRSHDDSVPDRWRRRGSQCQQGQTLATTMEAKTLFIVAGDLQEMEIHAKVDEADIGKIQAGQEAIFTVDAHPGRQFTATVRQLRKAPQVQSERGDIYSRTNRGQPRNLLLPGMTALVRITVEPDWAGFKNPISCVAVFSPQRGRSARAQRTREAELRRTPASVWVPGAEWRAEGDCRLASARMTPAQVAVVSGSLRRGDRVIVGEVADHAPKRLFGIRVGL